MNDSDARQGDLITSNQQFTADDVYKAIADGLLAFDLYRHDISQIHRAVVFRDQVTLDFNRRVEDSAVSTPVLDRLDFSVVVGAEVTYEGQTHTVTLVGDSNVVMQHDGGTSEMKLDALRGLFDEGKVIIRNVVVSGPNQSLTDNAALNVLSPKQLERALERARLIELAQMNPGAVPVSKRSIQRFQKAVREAGTGALERNLALLSRASERGNRMRKISDELIELIHQVVKDVYNNPSAVTKEFAFIQFTGYCQERGLIPCSLKTFSKEIMKTASLRAREGKRRAYQEAPIVWYLKLNEAIHGVRPFQFVHIDHTALDIFLGAPDSKDTLGKPWLSLAIDAESRAIVGFYLTFEAPSYRSCMMILRDIVRRYGRMPDMLVTDNGKEFHSDSFSRVCALYGTHLRFRPAAQPRFGAVMERVFGTVNSEFIHNLEGNSKLMKHVRTVTKSVRPEHFVKWTLPALHGALDYYFKNLYGTENHPAHGEPPEKHLARRFVETGVRRNRWVRYDRIFLIETCPSVDQIGTRVVDGQRGVKVNYVWYWSDAFWKSGFAGKSVDVRVDPWDVRTCYAFLGDSWHACASKLMARLKGYTEVELRCAFAELARTRGIKKKDLTPERISEWIRVLDAGNFDPRLRKQQAEARLIYDPLNMTSEKISADSKEGAVVDVMLIAPVPVLAPCAQAKTASPSVEDDDIIKEDDESSEYEVF